MWSWDVLRDKIWATPNCRVRRPVEGAGRSLRRGARRTCIRPIAKARPRGAKGRGARTRNSTSSTACWAGGDVRWIAARGRAEKADGERLMGVALDITARKEAELQAEKDRSALDAHDARVDDGPALRLDRAPAEPAAGRDPRQCGGRAQDARARTTSTSRNCGRSATTSSAEDNRAAEVIRRLGALYKRGEMKLRAARSERAGARDARSRAHGIADAVTLTSRHRARAVAAQVDGGRVQLQQVLLNLILNAADAMSDVEADERRLTIRTELDGTNVRLCVVDRGTGIVARTHQERVRPVLEHQAGRHRHRACDLPVDRHGAPRHA